MIKKVHDDTLKAGKIFGQAAARYATGHPLSSNARFFQNGPSHDGWVPPAAGGRRVDVNAAPEGELADIIFNLGDERHSRRIARAIVAARREKKLTRTRELA